MKIAIGLFGVYSNLYKKNNYVSDIFTLSFEKDIEEDINIIKSEYIDNNILNLKNVKLYEKQYHIKKTCIDYVLNMIRNYETKNNINYDIIVFASFRDIILNIPQKNGIYRTNYYMAVQNLRYEIIPSIEIVSNLYVRINGFKVINIYDLDENIFQTLLNILFKGKVIQPKFLTDAETNLLFCIPSVIKTSENPFNYVHYRSIFTHNERFQQTLKQVENIDKLNLSKNIYLLEGSNLDLDEMQKLSNYCNIVLFCKDKNAHEYANQNVNKSIYEVYCMKFMLEKIKFNWAFKFGGRYNFHDTFNILNFLKDKPVLKIIDMEYTFTNTENIIECIIYSIPKSYREKYINIYHNIINSLLTDSSSAIENLLYTYSDDIDRIEYLNVYGRDAIEGFDNLV